MRATQENIQFVATELDHPEGMNFGIDGQLYAGGEAGQIYGLAFDDRDRLLISCYVPDRIYLADTDGKIEILMEDPTAELMNRPTNVAIRDNKVYYANLGGWHVGAFDFDAGPMPLRYPQLR